MLCSCTVSEYFAMRSENCLTEFAAIEVNERTQLSKRIQFCNNTHRRIWRNIFMIFAKKKVHTRNNCAKWNETKFTVWSWSWLDNMKQTLALMTSSDIGKYFWRQDSWKWWNTFFDHENNTTVSSREIVNDAITNINWVKDTMSWLTS